MSSQHPSQPEKEVHYFHYPLNQTPSYKHKSNNHSPSKPPTLPPLPFDANTNTFDFDFGFNTATPIPPTTITAIEITPPTPQTQPQDPPTLPVLPTLPSNSLPTGPPTGPPTDPPSRPPSTVSSIVQYYDSVSHFDADLIASVDEELASSSAPNSTSNSISHHPEHEAEGQGEYDVLQDYYDHDDGVGWVGGDKGEQAFEEEKDGNGEEETGFHALAPPGLIRDDSFSYSANNLLDLYAGSSDEDEEEGGDEGDSVETVKPLPLIPGISNFPVRTTSAAVVTPAPVDAVASQDVGHIWNQNQNEDVISAPAPATTPRQEYRYSIAASEFGMRSLRRNTTFDDILVGVVESGAGVGGIDDEEEREKEMETEEKKSGGGFAKWMRGCVKGFRKGGR